MNELDSPSADRAPAFSGDADFPSHNCSNLLLLRDYGRPMFLAYNSTTVPFHLDLIEPIEH